MGILKTGIVCAGALLAAGAAETAYFYGRTMKRQNVNMDRTIKMAGTDWSQYSAILAERKAFMLSQPHEDVYQTSFDGLKLHASYFPAIQDTDKKRIVICFHGYTSRSLADFTGLTDYYFRHGLPCCILMQEPTETVRASISVSDAWTERMPSTGSTG